MEGVSGAVLVGGKSRRMGADKAVLAVGELSLIQRVVGALREVADELLLVGTTDSRYAGLGDVLVDDLVPDAGPLAGIYTALSAMRHSLCLVVACDMPFLNVDLLRYMLHESTGWDVVVPRRREGLEPLHAVYAHSCLNSIEHMLEERNLCPLDLFPIVRVRYLEARELASRDPGGVSFTNVNGPHELALAERMAKQRFLGGVDEKDEPADRWRPRFQDPGTSDRAAAATCRSTRNGGQLP